MKRCICAAVLIWIFLMPVCGLTEEQSAHAFFDRCSAILRPGDAWKEEAGGVFSCGMKTDGRVSVTVEGGRIVCIAAVIAAGNEKEAEEGMACLLRALDADASRMHAGILRDDSYWTLYLCQEEDAPRLCWQPQRGGEKYHRLPECSGMNGPRLITESAAQAQGFPACEICGGKETTAIP